MVPNGHDIIVSKHSSSGFVSCKFPKNDELTKHIMIQLSLPPELKHGIVKLSPPNTLASLARTHPALQVVAEQALYLSLHNPVLKCLETLATNSEKAGFVRFLTMDIYYYENNPDGLNWEQAMISYLLNALVNMHSLSDLRMRLSPIKSWSESLDNILWSVYEVGSFDLLKTNCWRHSNVHSSFRLQTLYCNADLDLSRIIKGQTELQILGIYNHYSNGARFLATLKQLQSAHLELHLPVIVALRVDFLDGFNQISVFPIFNSIDRYPSIDQVMAESFNKLELEERRPDTLTEISGLSIYLVDSSDIPSIHVLTKNMTTRFPGIIWLTFCFENPCEIVSFLIIIRVVVGLKSIFVISAITGDKENYLFIPLSERLAFRTLGRA